ncbi:MAG TPA: DUF6036 family nucleotidyltransferase [Thermoanaerobaculia bacterium]|nr:DUF6036 family nucleotidyltransferase [Thermoanaerobaculia bacterium]
MNRDYVEMLNELSAASAEFLVIGAHALAAHGYLRATKDLDIWVRPTPENAARVWTALVKFGAPLIGVTQSDFARRGTIYQMGVDPDRIDIITEPAGAEFEDAWQRRVTAVVDGVPYPVIGRDDLIATKRAAGRREDLIDIERLEDQ